MRLGRIGRRDWQRRTTEAAELPRRQASTSSDVNSTSTKSAKVQYRRKRTCGTAARDFSRSHRAPRNEKAPPLLALHDDRRRERGVHAREPRGDLGAVADDVLAGREPPDGAEDTEDRDVPQIRRVAAAEVAVAELRVPDRELLHEGRALVVDA